MARRGRRWARYVVIGIGLLIPVSAMAQPSAMDKAAADTLFTEAERLVEASQLAAACQKFAESQRLDPQLGTLLHLADCYERNGQTASAWASFREATQLAAQKGDGREQVARDRTAALEPNLTYVTITVSPDAQAAGVTVFRDTQPVGQALWGTASPIDPGAHRISAKAPGRKPWSQDVNVSAPGQLAVTVPALEPESAAPASPVPLEQGRSKPETSAPFPMRTLGFIVGGVGAVGVATGVVLAAVASSKGSDADTICPTGRNCSIAEIVDYENKYNDAKGLATGATVALVAGGVLLVGGAVLVLVAPSATAPSPGTPQALRRLRVGAAPGGAMAGWEATW